MSTSYALLLGLIIFFVLFIYFSFFSVSLRLEKNENEAEIAVKRKNVPFRWKNLVDNKNKNLGWIDLGNHILVLGNKDNLDDKEISDDLEGIQVERCKTEKDLLMGWQRIIKQQDPDFITGYNIFGFDFKYITDRAKILFPCQPKCRHPWSHVKDCEFKKFMNFGKMDSTLYKSYAHRNKKCCDKSQQLSSSALGDNTLDYIFMDGRILFDIQKEVQKDIILNPIN